jgi:hypothetical protein
MLKKVNRWLEERVLALLEDGHTIEYARGYADNVLGLTPQYRYVAGSPLAADDYHAGYGRASDEVDNRAVA